MNAPQPGPVLVVETDADGRQALGPLLPSADAPCLSCLLARRRASERPMGRFELVTLDDAQHQRLRRSRLKGGQLYTDGSAERLLCTRPLDHSCPMDDLAGGGPTLNDAVGPHLGMLSRVDTAVWLEGQFTCIAVGSAVLGSAGVPLCASGTATSPDATQARDWAICEALEHHAAGFWPDDALVSTLPSQAGACGQGPWVSAQILGNGQPVWVPAASVYMPFPDGQGGLVGHSEGLACGASCDDARQRAVAELVERQVVDRLWSHLAPQVAHDVANAVATDHVWEGVIARSMGLSVAVSLRAAEVGPPYGWAGFGCDVDDTLALAKARREAVHVLAHMRRCVAVPDAAMQTSPSAMDLRVLSLALRPGLAMAWAARLRGWAAGAGVAPKLAAGVRDAVAWRDITPPEVRRLGLSVVRAVWLDIKPG